MGGLEKDHGGKPERIGGVDEVSKEVMHCNPNDGRKREQRAPVPEIEGVDEDFFGQLLGMPRETQIPT
jgi:hypothetical protein